MKAGENFSTSELAGTWHLYGVSSAAPPWEGWFYGTIVGDASGAITSGSWQNNTGYTGTFTSGSFTLDSDGVVGGSGTLSGDYTLSLTHGKMHPDKNAITAVYHTSDGHLGKVILIKAGGSFSNADLDGAWYLFGLSTDAPPWEGWRYGVIRADAGGLLKFGSWETSNGIKGQFTGGTLNLDPAGVLSGSTVLAKRRTLTFTHGKMHPDKQAMTCVYTGQDGEIGLATLVKTEARSGRAPLRDGGDGVPNHRRRSSGRG